MRRWDASRSALAGRFAGTRSFVFLLGSRARHKNVQLLLDIAPDLDRMGLDVVVAGGSADVFAADRASSLAGNVRFLGYVSEDDLAFLYRSALLLAFPSLVEGFGLPVLEAMALGCPVVSADTASMPEIGADAILYAAPDDPRSWIERIGQIAADEGLRRSLAAGGPERARLFSWRETARGYLSLMHSHGARP